MKNHLSRIKKFFNLWANDGLYTACTRAFHFFFRKENKKSYTVDPITEGREELTPMLSYDFSPLVSVLIVSYNSSTDLKKLFPSLQKQSHKNLEIVIVENGTENNEALFYNFFPDGKYLKSENIGFAAANNLAYENSKGSYAFLVNPDVVLSEETISTLLDQFRFDGKVCCAIPKIYFSHKFIDFEIYADKDFLLCSASLEKQLNYKKYFVRVGENNKSNKKIRSKRGHLKISLPIDESSVNFLISGMKNGEKYSVVIDDKHNPLTKIKHLFSSEQNISLHLSADKLSGRNVINNAGSGLKNGMPYDIGFGEYDFSMPFDTPRYVEALCGAAALLDPKILSQRKIFINEFFAYYEDSELSHFMGLQDLKIKYSPAAVIYHAHSTSSSEGSPMWNTLVDRSSKFYRFLTGIENSVLDYKNEINSNNEVSKVLSMLDKRVGLLEKETLILKNRPTLAIYNSYWNTFGGGERHALSIAEYFSDRYDITLLSENDFSIVALNKYFNFNLKCRKLVVPCVDTSFTQYFDVFVNSTYRSNLISAARKNIYLVSFPHQPATEKFTKNYLFLHNSEFTSHWAKKYWGVHNGLVLFPVLYLNADSPTDKGKEDKIFSVGRFNDSGHSKRHDTIIKAFKKAKQKTKCSYTLHICGSYDPDRQSERLYFNNLTRMIDNSIFLHPNIEYNKMMELFSQSKFYVHATGFGVDENRYPEKLEHFGITVAEGVMLGAYPIVYSKGGPAGTIKKIDFGETFEKEKDLVNIFLEIFERNKIVKIPEYPLASLQNTNEHTLFKINRYLE